MPASDSPSCLPSSPPSGQALYRNAQLRAIEAAHADLPLMQRAGIAAAELAAQLTQDGKVLVLAGPGNNGGDAFEVARLLRLRFFEVSVVFLASAEQLPAAAAAAHRRFTEAGGTTQNRLPEHTRWALIVDGLFGIGLRRALAPPYAALVEAANTLAVRDGCPVLALDAPSGLNADTGHAFSPCVQASHTITFIAAKPGLYTADGPDQCGQITVAGLGLNHEQRAFSSCADPAPTPGVLAHRSLFAAQLKARRRNSHKGSFGSAGIVGGARGMLGALLLASRAALHLGCGRVYAAPLDPAAPGIDPLQPELMLRRPDAILDAVFAADLTALAVGPGLGQSDTAHTLLTRALAAPLPLLLDADALNLLAADATLGLKLRERKPPTVLTPHPAEAARLLGQTTAIVQSDRVTAATELASRYHAVIVLKGCGSVIATPEGDWYINPTGNAGLATAGSGDVLSGLISALLAQAWPAREATLAAVHLHGLAAEHLTAAGTGPVGLMLAKPSAPRAPFSTSG